MSNNRHGVMKIPTKGFGMAKELTGLVPDGDTAGVSFETIGAMEGVEQLDLLDQDHALVLIRHSEQAALNLEAVELP